jgi:hypothetical protein
VIDFCAGLKTTLLALEQNLDRAKRSLEASAVQASGEAKKHVGEAVEQLETFKAHAGLMAKAIRAELPEQTGAVRETLNDFGQEAQVAMRHAVVFLAETAPKRAESAAEDVGRLISETIRSWDTRTSWRSWSRTWGLIFSTSASTARS